MPDYASFARFYDLVQGDRTATIRRIQSYLSRFHPAAGSLLELGCGTGAILSGLAGGLAVTGLDQSPEMLAVAADKVPRARLVEADMTSFALDRQFDVVICVFDTLNHLPSFDGWISLFDRVHEHLAAGGLFVFDVNTIGRLRGLASARPYVGDFDGNVLLMDVRSGDGDVSIWTTRYFERQHDDLFRLYQETIRELGVPLPRIRDALAANFELLEQTDLDGGRPTDESDRVFFAYRHRPASRPAS